MTTVQDIESASARLFDKLTLQEKTLAKELIEFKHYDKEKHVVSEPLLFSKTINLPRLILFPGPIPRTSRPAGCRGCMVNSSFRGWCRRYGQSCNLLRCPRVQ
jgi:hypothetical protein